MNLTRFLPNDGERFDSSRRNDSAKVAQPFVTFPSYKEAGCQDQAWRSAYGGPPLDENTRIVYTLKSRYSGSFFRSRSAYGIPLWAET